MIGRWTPALAALALVIAAMPAQAQQFKPTRTIEFVVHGGPGSGNDVFARQLTTIIDQEKLSPVRGLEPVPRLGRIGAQLAGELEQQLPPSVVAGLGPRIDGPFEQAPPGIGHDQ